MSALEVLYPTQTIDRLAALRRASEQPFDRAGAVFRQRHTYLGANADADPGTRAMQRTWASYLDAADACGLLSDVELVASLTGDDDDAFRAAMAECAAAFVLSSMLNLSVGAKPESKSATNADLLVSTTPGPIYVEVKAPAIPRTSNHWRGNDSRAITACVKAAGRQLRKGRMNLLVLLPQFRTPVYLHRGQLMEAVLGQRALSVYVSLDGSEPPPPEPTFIQSGKLARLRTSKGGATTTDLTRIGAVMTIEERYRDTEVDVRHSVIVVHNPFAQKPINTDLFGAVPQLVPERTQMRWTDGHTGV